MGGARELLIDTGRSHAPMKASITTSEAMAAAWEFVTETLKQSGVLSAAATVVCSVVSASALKVKSP